HVKPKTRAILQATAGEPITVTWTLRSLDAKTTVPDVLVHFFVARENATGQRELPKLDEKVVVESALTMDFKPNDRAKGNVTFAVATPGSYLLRLETIGAS